MVPERVSHHVAGEVSRNELSTETVERRTIVVTDGNDVALCHAHGGELSVKHDRLAR
jgi:hypothetical protein